MYIGIVIREVRKLRGLTQLELSDETNISVRTIQRIEKDTVEPSLYSLKGISEILEVDFLKIKNKNSMAYVKKLLGININENNMTEKEKINQGMSLPIGQPVLVPGYGRDFHPKATASAMHTKRTVTQSE